MSGSQVDSTRSRLLAAATRLLARDGYRGLAIAELLRGAEATSGSLYHHFPGGKEELAATAIREAGLTARGVVRALFEQMTPSEALRTFFGGAMAASQASEWTLGCPVGTPAADGVSASAMITAAVDESLSGWIGALAGALEARGVAPEEAREVATLAIATYEGALLLARARRDPSVMEGAARRLAAEVDRVVASAAR